MVTRRFTLRSIASSAVLASSGCVQHPLPALDGSIEEIQIYRNSQDGEDLVAVLSKSGYHVAMEKVDTGADSERSNSQSESEKQAFNSLSESSSDLVHELLIQDSSANASSNSATSGVSAYHVGGDEVTSVLPNDFVEFQISIVDSKEILGFSKIVRQGSVLETTVVGYEGESQSDGETISTNSTISPDERKNLENTYSDIQYTLTVESTISEQFSSVNVYRTSERIYNRVTVGSQLTFVIEGGDSPRISSLP